MRESNFGRRVPMGVRALPETHRPGLAVRRAAAGVFVAGSLAGAATAELERGGVVPAPQAFRQEVSTNYTSVHGLPAGPIQVVEVEAEGGVRAFGGGKWFGWRGGRWEPLSGLNAGNAGEFVLPGADGKPVRVQVPWKEVRQVVRQGEKGWVVSTTGLHRFEAGGVRFEAVPGGGQHHQLAIEGRDTLWAATSGGLFGWRGSGWESVRPTDPSGRAWGAADVLGVAVDSQGQVWFATRAGVGCRTSVGWRFYEGRDGLPYSEFTGITAGQGATVWFGTRVGVVRLDGTEWQYRQGRRWLPDDEVLGMAVDTSGQAWIATSGGVGTIAHRPMTLASKAEFFEGEIARHIRRTEFGYVAEAPLAKAADRTTANPQDSDNDGLWTAMYGAGECFAYGATRDPAAKARAQAAFEALRFLQKVTQGGSNAPPKGFIARTIRPVEWPDPNIGRLEADREAQKRDRLWKVYEPRWPRSADGRWYWKSDTSSDELDGHYFFYPLYFDLCADTESERDRVREVVRDVTDHLLAHNYALVDHDGRPTRWAVFGPSALNRDPQWWPERGLNSLSLLSYLAVAAHVTGDLRYEAAARELVDLHGYAQNAMYPKVQHGPGSGNQSDDEMAFMSYYNLLRYSRDEALKSRIRVSFFHYWANEEPEMNPLFNFAYAAQMLGFEAETPWGPVRLDPWAGWHEAALETLRGFPLDRLNWSHRNSHRLDLVRLPPQAARDLEELEERGRGHRVNGRVLPVENRHFNHWNTDPWQLDYGGAGTELAAGTVYLLPYYMGLYHGYVEKPLPVP